MKLYIQLISTICLPHVKCTPELLPFVVPNKRHTNKDIIKPFESLDKCFESHTIPEFSAYKEIK